MKLQKYKRQKLTKDKTLNKQKNIKKITLQLVDLKYFTNCNFLIREKELRRKNWNLNINQ